MESKKLTSLHYRIYDKLKQHEGIDNAIKSRELSETFNISTRELRSYIHDIRLSGELEKVIGCSNSGYYICTIEDFAITLSRLMRQTLGGFKVIHALKRKANLHGQGKIKLVAYYKDFAETLAELKEPDDEDIE